MAHVFRWRYGDTAVRQVAVASASVIQVGDLLVLDTTAKAVEDMDYTTDEATAQEAGHDAFLGVALNGSAAGDTIDIAVATRGVFEYPIASATVAVGAYIGLMIDTDGWDPISQVVDTVAAANLSIGRCAKAIASQTTVYVEIVSTVFHSGVSAVA